MKYFRKALIFAITSAVVLVASFAYYLVEAVDVKAQGSRLASIREQSEQRRQYLRKIESIKLAKDRLVRLAGDGATEVDYSIVLVDHDLGSLMRRVASTYEGDLFFLENAVVESTSSGISVTMKGFKLSGGTR